MQQLEEMRNATGPTLTQGLPDSYITQFLAQDLNLSLAISNAYNKFQTLDKSMYERPEGEIIDEIQRGWCHLYPEDTRNPYIPLAAKGPWIVTMHGAVLHDNGGYGMLGFGHSPDAVLKAMSDDLVMANIMTPSFKQKEFMDAIRKEIGHNRAKGCPYASFLLMNSGSEGNSVADRLIDIHTGHVMEAKAEKYAHEGKCPLRTVKCVALKGCFHGRTYRPALWTDSCKERYKEAKAYSIVQTYQQDYCWMCEVNDCEDAKRLFKKAEDEGIYLEAMFIESVMGEGNPGVSITPEFYKCIRELTLKHDSMLLVDNIQAGLRATGNLSIVDYPGFETLPEPDFEVYSKAINAGQYPVSCLAMSERGQKYYRHGVYGNTMTGNPRACAVSAAVLTSITPALRQNIVDMGKYAVEKYKELQKEFPECITKITGTGLLYAVQLNDKIYKVIALEGAEFVLRTQGIGVIHGGHNALRFTPHFKITKEEIDMQVDFVKAYLQKIPMEDFAELVPRLERLHSTGNSPVRRSSAKRVSATLEGHLFDQNIINDVLNRVEEAGGTAKITSLSLGANNFEKTRCVLEFKVDDTEKFCGDLQAMVKSKDMVTLAF
jgi:4-aminobutyrate aminotransferase-like enzyme